MSTWTICTALPFQLVSNWVCWLILVKKKNENVTLQLPIIFAYTVGSIWNIGGSAESGSNSCIFADRPTSGVILQTKHPIQFCKFVIWAGLLSINYAMRKFVFRPVFDEGGPTNGFCACGRVMDTFWGPIMKTKFIFTL